MNPPRLLLPGILLFISFSLSAQKAEKTIWLKSGAIKAAAPLSQQSIESFNKAFLTTFNKSIALVQFEELPSEKERKILSAAGIALLSYLPDYAYTVAITAPVNSDVLKSARVKVLLHLAPQQKMDEALSKGQLPAYAVKVAGTVDVRVMFPKTIPASEVLAHLAEMNFEVLSKELQTYNVLDLRITASRLSELAASPYIEFVQAKPPPDEPLNLNSRSGSRANILNASLANGGKGLNGEGVVIGVGDNANIQLNTDFSGRVLASGTTALSAHGVHVTGTAAGAGILNELYRGYAPKAKIVSQLGSNIISRASVYIQDYNMVVTNNSYGNIAGCGTFGVYEGGSAVIDRMAFNHPKLLNVFAAGNSGSGGCAPYPVGFRTVFGSYQSAKNGLTVGNTTDSGFVITASSKGPAQDGRIKPEIAAMGTNVISTWATNLYISTTGTSMAAPAVTGGAALLYQRYRQLNGGTDPNSALMKALLCNGASDRGLKGPDFSYGFGWMNLLRSVDMLDSNRYFSGTSTAGSVQPQIISVPPNTAQLKVMLYWHDPAASPASTKALVNDLDLEVITPSAAVNLPQILDTSIAGFTTPSTMGADHINNVEQVTIDNPVAGNYTLQVKGTAIAENPSQEYYLVYDFVPVQLKLTSPVGGEAWAPTLLFFNMSKITWEADGLTQGTATIDYSVNGGATWVNIASGIDVNRRIFSWWVPGITTSQALVRITKDGSGESSTSNLFSIIPAPVVTLNAVQCAGYMAVTWRTIPGVTDYEVMRLYGDEMIPVAVTSDTTYSLTGLSTDSTYWVGVRGRIGGKSGLRSAAVSRRPVDGTCTGTISDHDLTLAAIVSPKSGRRFTSTGLTATMPVTVQVRNLDDAPVTGFTLRYSLDGLPWVTENLSTITIAAGAVYNHTFSATIDLAALGSRKLLVEVINASADPVVTNNSLAAIVRQLDNQPLTLGFFDNLETADVADYGNDTTGLAGIDRYDFENTLPIGRLRTFVNTGLAYSGSKAFTSEAQVPSTAPFTTNYITGTFNLGLYNASANDIRLDFQHLFRGQVGGAESFVSVRGHDTLPWVEVYRYTGGAPNSDYNLTKSIEIGDSLLAKGQNFSSAFQVRWGHVAHSPTIHKNRNFSIDDIRLYEVFNDVQMIRIDTPARLTCGLNAAAPLAVTIHNSHNGIRTNIPVKYSVNNGPWIREVVAVIGANTTIQYVFTNTLNLSSVGVYTIRTIVDDSTDSFHQNDTAVLTLHNAPLINAYPYLQNFETGDGGFYAEGINSSWEYGTPASPKISKAASGTKVWKTRLSGNHNDEERSYLYAPCFNLSGLVKPTLSFSVALDLEDCGATFCDGVSIEYSVDGVTWTRLDTAGGVQSTNWYNKNYRVWSVENYTRWHTVSCALPDSLDQIRFRFAMFSDEAVNNEGIAIDDIHVYDNTKGIYDGVTMSAPVTNTVSGNNWVDFETGGKLVASIHPNNQNLGATDVQAFINAGAVRYTSSQYYHNRNLVIKPATITLTDSVSVRFYFLDAETEALIGATGCSACAKPASAYELGVSKYSDADDAFENGTISDNNQGTWSFTVPEGAVKIPFDKGYYVEFKTKDFSEFWLNNGGFNRSTPLPVQLTNFAVQKLLNGDVSIKWTTENEVAILRYEIELANGNADLSANQFIKIGEVGSKGNAASGQDYEYLDDAPGKSGVRYYRLKIIEQDGSASYSAVRSVVFTDALTWKIFPNPSEGVFHFTCQAPRSEDIEAVVLDAKGSIVQRYKTTGTGFLQKITINLADKIFANGMYLLQVNAGGKRASFKLYKQ